MSLIPYLAAYAGIAVFIGAVIVRFLFWAKMPIHMRWELYPVAHEGKKAAYGGSYLEEPEWWTKKRHTSLLAEALAMFVEIVFLVALWEHNRKLWYRSFPFHFGLYLVIAATGVMVFGGLLGLVWPAVLLTWFARALQVLTICLAVAGMLASLVGAIGLLHRRLTDPELKDFTSPADLFNLAFFVGAFGLALVTWIAVDTDFSRVSFFVSNLVSFRLAALPGSGAEVILPILTILALSALLAYIPLTHMSHFVGKYFAYHAIRWNDAPNMRGGDQEAGIQGVLTLPVSWKADHIQGDGKKNWAQAATEDMHK
jgi:nitrate reductase gamma subunit